MANLEGILERWIKLDLALSVRPQENTLEPCEGLRLEEFAKQFGVSVKAIRRDIEVIERVTGLNVDYDYRRKTYSYRVERAPPHAPLFNREAIMNAVDKLVHVPSAGK